MTIGRCNTTEEAARNMAMLRGYRPYMYGGVWYVAMLGGDGYAYRSQKRLTEKAVKLGIQSFEFAIVSSQEAQA